MKAKITALCHHARTSTELIETLTPVLRGWANYHRHVICGSTFARLDSFVWQCTYRWAKRRHANKTGRWIADRDFPHQPGEAWRFTDPRTGRQLLRVQSTITLQHHLKVRATANPFAFVWAAYFEHRDRQMTQQAISPFRATVLRQQQGLCPICRQGIQEEDALDLHHRDGNHLNNHRSNLLFLHPNCHRQHHYAPDTETVSPRPLGGVAHA